MVIDTVSLPFFFYLDLWVEIFFDKEGTAEKGSADFKVHDSGTSKHLKLGMKEIFTLFTSLLFVVFIVTMKE